MANVLSTKLFHVFLLLTLLTATALAQTQLDLRPRNCAISGRVTINGQPAPNAQVTATEITLNRPAPLAADGSQSKTVFKTRTDANGIYQFTGLPAARYGIDVASRAFIPTDSQAGYSLGTFVTLEDGETRDKVDFALLRGGVITGRVTDSEGRAVIAERVNLFRVERNRTTAVDGNDGYGYVRTDDRGTYRAYGLRPGNYIASVNGEPHRASDGHTHLRTFHPDATDEKQAKTIEVKAGEEAADVDIKLAIGGPRYEATGRVVDADTGKPLLYIVISCYKVRTVGGNQEDGGDQTQTDAEGNFRLSGLSPGHYSVSINGSQMMSLEHYVEGEFFDINDSKVSGLVIKAAPAGAISGVAVVEGVSDPTIKAKLSQIIFSVFIRPTGSGSFGGMGKMLSINADSTFRLGGLSPGAVLFNPMLMPDSDLQFIRIERGGAEIKGNLVIGKGEKINDLRLVFGSGTGVIRGHVQVTGGQLSEGWQLSARARRVGATNSGPFNASPGALVDKNGQFVIERLFPGEYELSFSSVFISNGYSSSYELREPKQKITVTNNAEAHITVSVNLPKEGQEK